MKILITGMTSRMTSEKRVMSFSPLLARHLRRMGHEVDVTWLRKDYASAVTAYDAVIAGVASPLSPSATYTVPTLLTIQAASDAGNLVALLVDDPDVRKIADGTASTLRQPIRLASSYYSKRPGSAQYESDASVKKVVLESASWVLNGTAPVLWPAHTWASMLPLSSVFSDASERALGLDVTAPLLALAETKVFTPLRQDRLDVWLVEKAFTGSGALAERTTRSLMRSVAKAALPHKMDDKDIVSAVEAYQVSYGVIQGSVGDYHGWWTPTPALTLSLADTVYIPSPDEGVRIGGHLYRVPYQLEGMDPYEYDAFLFHQQSEFKEKSWTAGTLSTHLNGVLGLPPS